MNTTTKTNWVIFGSTNPYHASIYKHKTGGNTEWVQDYCVNKTAQEISEMLQGWAADESDNTLRLNDADIDRMRNDGEDVSWYVGAGVYENNHRFMKDGETVYTHDIWTYHAYEVTELSDDQKEMLERSGKI